MRWFACIAVAIAIFFSGCSTKEVYEPKNIKDDWNATSSMDADVVASTTTIAQLDDDKVLIESKVLELPVAENERVIGYSDGWVITSSIDGNTTLTSENNTSVQHHFSLKQTVATASIKGDTLAVLFADNEMALYSVQTQELLFKEQGGNSLVVNDKIVAPLFYNDLVLFATLDGKVVIVNVAMKKMLRSVIVSSSEHFNNTIYLEFIENKIVAATGYELLSLAQKEHRARYELRDALYDGKHLYIATKQGEIIALTSNLQEVGKKKFPFAHILGMISQGKKLYILEKEGYVIVLDKNMLDYDVYEVSIDDDADVYTTKDAFYVGDTKISIK